MSSHSANSTVRVLLGLLVAAVLVAACIVAIVAVTRMDVAGDGGSGLASSFEYELAKYITVDPELIHYRQAAEFAVPLTEVRAIAVGPEDTISVCGDNSVVVLAADGTVIKGREGSDPGISLAAPPTCLAVGPSEYAHPGRIYVGVGDHVETFSPEGDAIATWENLGEKAVLTSIAVAEEDVFVADAGNRVVWRFNVDGQRRGKIGEPDPRRGIRGFVIPSPYFDVAITHDQLLRVVNPGARRVDAFTFDGDPVLHWGAAGPDIERFFGCCNPISMCLLPDDRFVTAEKGLPRIKVYSIDGDFECVVAGPEQLTPTATKAEETRSTHQMKVFDVAADSLGRVLVLDPNKPSVRVFQLKEEK
jgi:hypothetical protein